MRYQNTWAFDMGIMQKTLIIIPCYNEAGRLCVKSFVDYTKANNWAAFIFVNDGSSDSTKIIIDEIGCNINS